MAVKEFDLKYIRGFKEWPGPLAQTFVASPPLLLDCSYTHTMSIFSTPTSAPQAVAKPQDRHHPPTMIIHDLTGLPGNTKVSVGTYGKQNAQLANQVDGVIITNYDGDIVVVVDTHERQEPQ